MAEELINTDGLGSAMIYIVDKLNMTLAQVYEIYARAQFTMGAVQILLILIWFISMIVIFVYAVNILKREAESKTMVTPDVLVPLVFIMFISGALLGFLLAFLYSPIMAILCPEYSALTSLMHDIGEMVN